MGGKYKSIQGFPGAPIYGRGCGQYEDAAYINDVKGAGCWAVKGTIIPIGDLRVSTHEACEYINAMFKVDSTRSSAPTWMSLSA